MFGLVSTVGDGAGRDGSKRGRDSRSVRLLGRLLLVVAVVAGGISLAQASSAVETETKHEVRVLARHTDAGDVEVAVQQRSGDSNWGSQTAAGLVVTQNAAVGRWLVGTELALDTESDTEPDAASQAPVVRVVARRVVSGGVEVGVQQHLTGGKWSGRLLPAQRFVSADAPVRRWLISTPVTVSVTSVTSATAASDPAMTSQGAHANTPAALVTPTGVPVAVLETTDGGWLVRTPCGNTAEIASGTPIHGVRVVIDPGHGGRYDTGAVGPNGLVERDLNLTLSRAVLDELADRGIPATTTRTADYGTLLEVRAALADALDADVLVSIHHNAPNLNRSSKPGTEIFVQSASAEQPEPASARLGGLLYQEITSALSQFEGISWRSARNAGVLRVLLTRGGDAYGMIRRPSVPTALVEYGYLSNSSEAQLFATDTYIRTAAKATADAIETYLNTDDPGSGFIEQPRVFNPARAPSRCNETALE